MNSTLSSSAPKIDMAEQQRLDSFKLGWGAPTAGSRSSRHSHGRSHSRNGSISLSISSLSLSTSNSTNSHDFSLPTSMSASSTSSNPKRNSHHRRRSSVSTRHESAEIMGVSIPDLPALSSEDNINLGEKDSIRRRALWALEGKPDVSFSKVEIPELSTPDIEKRGFEFPTKPSFPPGSAFGSGGLNSLINSKRDSFKLLGGMSKDQLGTLIEEEEEDEDDGPHAANKLEAPAAPPTTPITPVTPVAIVKTASTKPRPATLALRPLSLTPENLATIHGLPTPSPTPVARSGLRSLSLRYSLDDESVKETAVVKEDSFTFSPTPHPQRRPVLNLNIQSARPDNASHVADATAADKPVRRSSISYKSSSSSGLPTPEMTPTFPQRRFSNSTTNSSISSMPDGEEEMFPSFRSQQSRPLSASEQHFLFKSHNLLLARIQDLERALSVKRSSVTSSSRPLSIASSDSSEPSDEMLRLISDLKAERDELKQDVAGWRTRVNDLEKQIGVLGVRVEAERREAWVARSKVNVVDAERKVLEKQLEESRAENDNLRTELERARDERKDVEEELERWRKKAEALSAPRRDELEDVALATPTPTSGGFGFVSRRPRGLGFTSLDSSETATDVELESFGFGLKAVSEADEDEEDNGLAGYEDQAEDDDLIDCQSPTSSFGSEQDFPRSVQHIDFSTNPSVKLAQATTPPAAQTHASRGSLSKTWSFPNAVGKSDKPEPEAVDRFFGCLEDGDAGVEYSYERSKGLFTSAFSSSCDDDDIPFFIAAPNVQTGLDVVVEEAEEEEEDTTEDGSEQTQLDDDDDDDMFGDISGIKITFTPPTEDEEPITAPKKVATPTFSFEDSDEEEDVQAFNFGRPTPASAPAPVTTTPKSYGIITPPSSSTRASGIPRPSTYKTATAPVSPSFDLPSSHSANSYSTPPAKRPSFIPQPSPRSQGTPTKPRPSTTFIRQPQRKQQALNSNNDLASASSFCRSYSSGRDNKNGDAQMKSVDLSSQHNATLTSPFSSPKILQSFASFWSPKASTSPSLPNQPVLPKTFVSRDAQLAKLKSRLGWEKEVMLSRNVCSQCDGETVYL